jgi:FkbM family methyltransferase
MYKSQWEQDKWLNNHIFHNKKRGVFVDVGAHDGVYFSNTHFFEKVLDWTGICIEANKNIFQDLKNNRKCICLNVAADNVNSEKMFTSIEGECNALNGLTEYYNDMHLKRIELETGNVNVSEVQVECRRLEDIFTMYDIRHVDYMSIDTEGAEMAVLQGIDFDKVDIRIIGVEENYEHESILVREYLYSKGYMFRAKIQGDAIFIKPEYPFVPESPTAGTEMENAVALIHADLKNQTELLPLKDAIARGVSLVPDAAGASDIKNTVFIALRSFSCTHGGLTVRPYRAELNKNLARMLHDSFIFDQ